jgi:hypothetical protein
MKEEDRVRQIMVDMATGDDIGHKLIYDQGTKTIRPVSKYHDPDSSLNVEPEDATLGGGYQ